MALKYGKAKRLKMFHREYLFSPFTFEEYSASKGDYWNAKDSMIFKDSEGNEMSLMGDRGIGANGQPTIVKIGSPVKASDLLDRIGR